MIRITRSQILNTVPRTCDFPAQISFQQHHHDENGSCDTEDLGTHSDTLELSGF